MPFFRAYASRYLAPALAFSLALVSPLLFSDLAFAQAPKKQKLAMAPIATPPTTAKAPAATQMTIPQSSPIAMPLPLNSPDNSIQRIDPAIAPSPNAQAKPTDIPARTEANPIHAMSVHSLSLSDALRLVEQNNPQLVAARKNIDINLAGVGIAGEIPNPQVQAFHYWGNIVALGTNEQAGLTQQVETAGKRKKRVVVAKSQVTLSQGQYNAMLWDTRSQARQAYIQLAAAKENIDLIEAQSELAQNLVRIAEKRVKAGAAPLSEQLQAQLAFSQIDAQRIQALMQLRQAKGLFNALLGNPLSPGSQAITTVPIASPITPNTGKQSKQNGNTTLTASTLLSQTVPENDGYDILDEGYFNGSGKTELVPFPETPSPDFAGLLAQAQKQRPDLLAALQQVKVNQDQLKLTKAQRVPDLYVSVGAPFLHVKDQFAPINGRNNYYGFWAQVAFTVPVFHNQKSEIQQGVATLQQSQLQVNAVQKQLVSDLYNDFQGLEGSKMNINLYQQNLLPSSAEVLRLAQKSYQYGKTGLTSVIVAQQQIQQVRQSYIQSVLDYHKAWSDLEKTVGFKLDF